jgi:RNA recognition motif-containing protein
MSSGKKVFVGNLNYDTSEDDLKEAFSKAGKVIEAKVVRRGNRSKGYGFVEFETDEEAKKSVEVLDKMMRHDRAINVQVSTSTGVKVGNGDGNEYPIQQRPRQRYNRPPPYRNFYYQRPMRGGGGPRRMYYLRNNFNDNGNNRRRNNNRPVRKYNTKPQPKEDVEKIESKTTIFVANLPFSVDDEGLVSLFSKCGQIRTAHVVRNKGRSKGFGFVEFESQEGQTNALTTMDNHPVPYKNGEQKNLSVKVAMAEIRKSETQQKLLVEDS